MAGSLLPAVVLATCYLSWTAVHAEFDVRLVGGISDAQGRLEVFINGSWGTVCDDRFNENDAKVVCRQLGFNTSNYPIVRYHAYYGEGQDPIWLDNVECKGCESNLSQCAHRGTHNCDHGEDVGVECEPPPTVPVVPDIKVRLVNGGAPFRGRIELYWNGQWQTMCDECLTENIARVICTSVGFKSSSPAILRSAYFGRGSGRMFQDDLYCLGSETNLGQCSNFGRGDHDHSQDASLDCLPSPSPSTNRRDEFRVRLEGRHSWEGRLEVEISGQWGTVCDDGFTKEDAIVACRSLGFSSSDPVVRLGAYYGEATGPILMDNVNCIGNESNLAECSYKDGHNCDHSEDVVVDCMPSFGQTVRTDFRIRLKGGNSSWEGRLEVERSGQWGTVCDDGFTKVDAIVVCRSLGFNSSDPVVRSGAYYGEATGPILMDNVNCIGNESNLEECSYSDGHNCDHSEDVVVDCMPSFGPTPRTDFRVRLKGRHSWEGRLEVEISGQWGTVCDDGFTKVDAIVACRSLGFDSSDPVVRLGAYFGEATGPILMDNVNCIGNESNLAECSYKDGHNCDHSEDVVVDCMPSFGQTVRTDFRVRLKGGNSSWEGRLEVERSGQWGTVCDDGFTKVDAIVVCRSLGFNSSDPVVRSGAYYGEATGPILMDNVNCIGNESNLEECSYRDGHNCDHSEDVVVDCMPSFGQTARSCSRVRLQGGNSSYEGRLEVEISGQWGTVCDDGFTKVDAIVACRSLGFSSSDPVVLPRVYYGEVTLPILMDNVNCIGNESNLQECSYKDGHNCDHGEDVGLKCFPFTRD